MYQLSLTSYPGKKATLFFLGTILAFLFLYTNAPAEAACDYPSQILNLTNWKETLPTGTSGSPTEIVQTSLASYTMSPYFHVNSTCNGVVFRAPVNGVTTSGSGYPRSELREMANNGKDKASWSTTSGINTLFIDQAITAVPKTKKHVVAGQIHDASDDVIVIRLEYPKLFIDINGNDGPTLDANYVLGKRFTVKFVSSEGKINIYYNGSAAPAYTLSKSGSGYYFKAGAYTQSNCSKETDCSSNNYGEVVIYNLALNGQTITPTADTTAPAISVVSPTSNASVSGAILLSATATDNVGVSGVQFKIDGNNIGAEDVTAPYSINWDSLSVANGTHALSAVARDAAGNKTTSNQIAINVNNATSEPTPAPAPTPTPAPEPTPTMGGLSFEAESGVVTAPMQVVSNSAASNGKYVVQTTDSGTGNIKYTFDVPSDGQYQLRTRVISPSGSSNSINYILDNNSSKTLSFPDTIKSWTWADGPTVTLTKGAHTLTILKREKNTQLDAFEFKAISSTPVVSTVSTTPFEAESGAVSGGMSIMSDDSSASGQKYIKANSSGSVVYQVNVPTSGTYRVAGWIKAASGSSDSFYIAVDGKSAATWTLAQPTTAWTYDVDDGHTFSLSAGVHTLALKYREAGAKIDKLVLVKQ